CRLIYTPHYSPHRMADGGKRDPTRRAFASPSWASRGGPPGSLSLLHYIEQPHALAALTTAAITSPGPVCVAKLDLVTVRIQIPNARARRRLRSSARLLLASAAAEVRLGAR